MSTRQPNLFGPPGQNAYGAPLSSPADPPTSKEAGANHQASGKRGRHCQIVWAVVMANPGLTGAELWEVMNKREQEALKTSFEVYRRLNDLRLAGRVWQGEARKCSVKGTKMVVWHPGSMPAS